MRLFNLPTHGSDVGYSPVADVSRIGEKTMTTVLTTATILSSPSGHADDDTITVRMKSKCPCPECSQRDATMLMTVVLQLVEQSETSLSKIIAQAEFLSDRGQHRVLH
jgi:hypothetical protein